VESVAGSFAMENMQKEITCIEFSDSALLRILVMQNSTIFQFPGSDKIYLHLVQGKAAKLRPRMIMTEQVSCFTTLLVLYHKC